MPDGLPLPDASGLIERDDERRILAEAAQVAWSGEGRFVIVEGPAGIGKSALIASVRDAVRTSGRTVLSARCSALESTYAFGVVRQLFESAVRRSPTWLDGPAGSSRAAFDTPRESPSGGFHDVSHSVLHGLYWLTVNACADGPLTLVVDDVQWCDGPSLRFLTYLAGRLSGLPLAILASARTGA
jgi:predicted ATPase